VTAPVVECRGIRKAFGAVAANDGVDLEVLGGEVHGVVGENGAGKSTLMSILYGHLAPDAGELRVNGRSVRFRSPSEAIAAGIGIVHQQFTLVESFTVLENLLLGRERAGRRAVRAALARLGRDFGLALAPDVIAGALPVGLRQRLEIVKALLDGPRILILDEPTAVLTPPESERLFALLRRLAADGKSVLFVTHRLREVLAVTDRLSVMRAGRVVATVATRTTDAASLAELMIGRRPRPPARAPGPLGAPALELADLAVDAGGSGPDLRGIGFSVRAGEIVGIAGVAGNGQSELLLAIAGILPMRGSLRIGGCEAAALGIAGRRALGLAYIPEDRLGVGLIAAFTAEANLILGDHRRPPFAHGGLSVPAAISAAAARQMRDYDVQPLQPKAPTAAFSGGNQQKLLCAREMERRPLVLIVGQPTRGIDIGASEFVHRRLLELKAQGVAILVVSADLDELRTLGDRLLVMAAGRIVGTLAPGASDREIGLLMGAGSPE
jgi:ABC-type uncharacterized transport system ATPase subunit